MPYTFKHGDRPLDGVTIQRAVGRGGFGEVYYALTDSGKQLALKYLRDNPEVELRGIAHVMNLKSPHLITIYDVKTGSAGEPFVLMEYVSGPSLRDLLNAEPRGVGPQKAAYILSGIAQGLSYLHERGIVHRDLKPGNIFYDDGYVKIGDYGLSKHIAVSQHSGQTVSVGTVHYMAPEIGSGSYTKAIDIYALGVILYEMLTGRLPFTGSSMGEILMRHLSERPDLSAIAEPFAAIVRKALAKDPRERYQDAAEMAAELRESADLSASIASFDASVFSNVPRSVASDDPTRTMSTPPRPQPGMMDARFAVRVASLEARAAEQAERLQKKLDKRAAKLEGREFRKAWKHSPAERRQAAAKAPSTLPPGKSRILHALLLIGAATVCAIVAGAAGPWRGHGEAGWFVWQGVLIFAPISALLTHFVCLPRVMLLNTAVDRVAFASLGMLATGLFIAIGFDAYDNLGAVALSPIAAFLVCDWGQRIESGRRGHVRLGDAVSPAIVGLIAAGIADADGATPLAAVLCGLVSLFTQAAAAMWPVTSTAAGARPAADAAHFADEPPRYAAPEAARAAPLAADYAARGTAEAAARGSAPSPADDGAARQGQPPEVVDAARPGGHATRSGRRGDALEPDAPSFVGRAASAGLAFFGKVLLLAGLTFSVLYNTLDLQVDGGERHITMRDGVLMVQSPWAGRSYVIPRVVPLIPVVLGSIALLLARRHGGGMHFFRAVLACGMFAVACLLTLGPAAEGVRIFLGHNDWGPLRSKDVGTPLIWTIGLLCSAACLMFWPRRRARRTGGETIVI